MTRCSLFFIPLLLALLAVLSAGGCADDRSDAPRVDQAHPPNWILQHASEARERLTDCRSCHGQNFQGSGEAVSCFACHFGGPPQFGNFFIHPPEWGENVIAGHQTFPQAYSWTTCGNAACHGTELRGGVTGPSCFLAQCHAQGPPAPHPELFFVPQAHGPAAKNQQFFCRNCHGRPPNTFDGGFVSDPQIINQLRGNCSLFFCHPAATAHPTNWQGTNDPDPTYFASHRDIDRAAITVSCALCHKTDAAGTGPIPASPSCFAGQFTNADGSATACHAGGPGTVPHPVGQEWLLPDQHVAAAQQQPQFCTGCHVTGGVQPACAACHTAGDPLQVTACASCHGAPPNGNAAPNRAGGHAFGGHQGFIAQCQNCHQGVGSGTLQHFDRTGVATPNLPAEVVPSGAALFNFTYTPQTATCSNVVCHGPRGWYGGN